MELRRRWGTRVQHSQCAKKYTPMQTRMAAVQRRRSTFSFRKIFAAMALVTSVSEAEAGATRLRFRWLRAKSSEKKASAKKPTPQKKSGQVTTARIAPLRPEWAR